MPPSCAQSRCPSGAAGGLWSGGGALHRTPALVHGALWGPAPPLRVKLASGTGPFPLVRLQHSHPPAPQGPNGHMWGCGQPPVRWACSVPAASLLPPPPAALGRVGVGGLPSPKSVSSEGTRCPSAPSHRPRGSGKPLGRGRDRQWCWHSQAVPGGGPQRRGCETTPNTLVPSAARRTPLSLPGSPLPGACGQLQRKPRCGSLVGANVRVTGPAASPHRREAPGRSPAPPRPSPTSVRPRGVLPSPPVRCHRHPTRSSARTGEAWEGTVLSRGRIPV